MSWHNQHVINRAYELDPLGTHAERKEYAERKLAAFNDWLAKPDRINSNEKNSGNPPSSDEYVTDRETFLELGYVVQGGWGPVKAVSLICKACFYIRSTKGDNSPASKPGDDRKTKPVVDILCAMKERCPRSPAGCSL